MSETIIIDGVKYEPVDNNQQQKLEDNNKDCRSILYYKDKDGKKVVIKSFKHSVLEKPDHKYEMKRLIREIMFYEFAKAKKFDFIPQLIRRDTSYIINKGTDKEEKYVYVYSITSLQLYSWSLKITVSHYFKGCLQTTTEVAKVHIRNLKTCSMSFASYWPI